MNTEINLLEKKTNKYIAPLFFGAIFVLGLLAVLALLYFQQAALQNKILTDKTKITELEIVLAEYNQKFASQDKLKRLEIEVDEIRQTMTPHLPLYYDVIGLLPRQNQMITYTYSDTDRLVIHASFPTLDNVAHYLTKLTEQVFIVDTELTQVDYYDPSYEATLTILIDQDLLVEEFANK